MVHIKVIVHQKVHKYYLTRATHVFCLEIVRHQQIVERHSERTKRNFEKRSDTIKLKHSGEGLYPGLINEN